MLHYKLYIAGSRLFTLQQPRQSEALHYNLYTAGYRHLHYNSPASRRLYITSFTQPDTGFYITTAPPARGFTLQVLHSWIQAFTLQQPRQSRASTLQVTLPTSHSQHKKKHQQSTKHYDEEFPLSSKLGQVSAMSSITSYVKDSLSKLNSTQFPEVSDFNFTYSSFMSQFIVTRHRGILLKNRLYILGLQ
ncbi:hypothetical protein KY290_017055 [Solanum tuberosum]|uniref:Uncharacterized protein n=1 Tax=Solanum tuberosum TaxID=4113 RepID=A0ABQ7VA95_SOLTU|nr:hypothetical protein KY290_017055 [Solanum tuberosum]